MSSSRNSSSFSSFSKPILFPAILTHSFALLFLPFDYISLNSSFIGYIVSPLFILWCCTSASGIFVSILRLSEQRLLVAYPVGLFYACFALMSVFDVGQ